ncbi:MAG: carbohydrate ABC transporter permease [Lachnospiraceae bacterium]|nr:carbohydrate ABC transporter permease [Lachnospiraceae bacterium]
MKVKSVKTIIGDYIFVFLCVIVAVICLTPMISLLAKSLSSTKYLVAGEVFFLPKGLNFKAYAYVLKEEKYIRSFIWTVLLTVICTLVSLTITSFCAYPLIYDNLKGKKVINVLITFTMFFNAGMIPNYMLMKSLHFINNPLVLIVPSCLSIYNMIIMRSFFYGIPDSLRESAEMDGASFFKIFTNIYLPLSKPVYATLALFYAVGRWNGYTDALMYVNDEKLYPLQRYLYDILNSAKQVEASRLESQSVVGMAESMKDAVVMFSTIPILLVYPWLQRYFIAGATLGAVKE